MRKISFFLSLLLSVSFLFCSCSKDEENGEVLSSTMWRNDSCMVTLPFIFSADAIVQHDNNCDVALDGNKITVLTKETLGTSRIVIEEQGKGRVTVDIEIVMPDKFYSKMRNYLITPELDDNAMIVVNRYINENTASLLEFEENIIKAYNDEEETIFSGNYEYCKRILTIHKEAGETIHLKVESLEDHAFVIAEDITDVVKTLIPDAPAEKYSLTRMYKSHL